MKSKAIIIGAGPAGLTAGYLLAKKGESVEVFEADEQYVGGIARTVKYKGFHFDIGGHRFFSKSQAVEDLWTELLPNDMLDRPRSSRIYYNGQFFAYPLKAFEALFKLGVWQSTMCVASYAKTRVFPNKNPRTFEEWVTQNFGERLFKIFFETYTEKVWGMKCSEISADWAAQRIKGLSLSSAIMNALIPQKPTSRGETIKTLIDSFRYPRKGPGMMWEVCAEKIQQMGGKVHMGRRVSGLSYNADTRTWRVEYQRRENDQWVADGFAEGEHVISSMPVRELVSALGDVPTEASKHAAKSLRYRDFITVALVVKERDMFDDNWIYVHDPGVKVGRVQNFKSWSPELVPDPSLNCLGLEYFCFEGDGLWNSTDEQLIELGKKELRQLKLVQEGDVVDGAVVRQPKAYPVYDDDYAGHVETIRAELASKYPSLHLIGRNGMHKYNNQDHAMMTAMLTADNIIAGEILYDVWQVNQDAEYHEAGNAGAQSGASGLRAVPKKVSSSGEASA